MKIADSKRIPGMVETVEQQMLYECARDIALHAGESIVEFGTFFGRSTYCLAEGLAANTKGASRNRIHAYDSFRCQAGGRFASYVTQFAGSAGVDHLLAAEAGEIDFRKVFEHYLAKHLGAGLVAIHAGELAAAAPPDGDIALMHVDCPKFYAEFKYVLYRFFPRLRPGAVVIFQDFFYHWSATLIAGVQLLQEHGIVRMLSSSASSLKTEVVRRPVPETLLELDLAMQKIETGSIIDRAMASVASLDLDRKAQFFPRLALAKAQHLWESGDFQGAAAAVEALAPLGGEAGRLLFADFLDLMKNGFSIRYRYGKRA